MSETPGKYGKKRKEMTEVEYELDIETIEKIDRIAAARKITDGDVLTVLINEYEKRHKIKPIPARYREIVARLFIIEDQLVKQNRLIQEILQHVQK